MDSVPALTHSRAHSHTGTHTHACRRTRSMPTAVRPIPPLPRPSLSLPTLKQSTKHISKALCGDRWLR